MERFICFFAIFLTVSTTFSFGQSPYHLDWKKESLIGVVGASTWGSSYLFAQQTPIYSQDQITDLSRARINSFDRVATYNFSLEAQKTSDVLSLSAKMLPLVFLADKNPRNDFGTIAALYAETYLIANGITVLSKTAVQRTRPYVYNEAVGIDEKQTPSARYSFISGHTSKTAAMWFFTAKVYADYHPDSEWRPFVWAVAATVPAITGYMRVKGGKHYPTDVMAGYAVGALTGILVPHLHKHKHLKKAKNDNMKLTIGLTGANFKMVF